MDTMEMILDIADRKDVVCLRGCCNSSQFLIQGDVLIKESPVNLAFSQSCLGFGSVKFAALWLQYHNEIA